MKPRILLLLTLLIATLSFAQQGINYKALIKDDLGNVLANATNIDVQFIIYEGDALSTQVYQEIHTNVSTDANGIIITTIGKGTTNDDFSGIKWQSDTHWLNTQIDTGNGFTNMGTTEFMAVPYALSAANISGLEKITENNGPQYYTGWRLIGQNPENYGSIGQNSVDLSSSFANSEFFGATGSYSVAIGFNTEASGSRSTALGFGTRAASDSEIAIGTFNTFYTPISVGSLDIADRLFVIGNGLDFENKSDALIVLKNGTITAPSLDLSEITDDKALITKEYADTNLGSFGLEQIIENGNTGWRLVGVDPNNHGNIGDNAIDLSTSPNNSTTRGATGSESVAMGFQTSASGIYSTAMGGFTNALGDNSIAMGSTTTASGTTSTAMGIFTTASGTTSTTMGRETTASGEFSTAMGFGTIASGNNSTTMGLGVSAPSFTETALGSYNQTYTPGANGATGWNPSDRLFTIGNGATLGARSNALVVLKNGTITAPSLDLSEITDDKALITKEYMDANSGGTGLEQYTDNEGNVGWNLINASQSPWIGNNAVDISQSIQVSPRTGALGELSFAQGEDTTANGERATALGENTIAAGNNSVAIGNNTVASRENSFALGTYNDEDTSAILMVGNGNQTNSNTAFKIEDNGNAVFDAEIQSTSTGNANMIPIAYGSVNGSAIPVIVGGTGNFSVTRNSTSNEYTINVTDQSLNLTNTVTSVVSNTSNFRTVNVTYSGGNMVVHIFIANGTKVASPFQFTIYKL